MEFRRLGVPVCGRANIWPRHQHIKVDILEFVIHRSDVLHGLIALICSWPRPYVDVNGSSLYFMYIGNLLCLLNIVGLVCTYGINPQVLTSIASRYKSETFVEILRYQERLPITEDRSCRRLVNPGVGGSMTFLLAVKVVLFKEEYNAEVRS